MEEVLLRHRSVAFIQEQEPSLLKHRPVTKTVRHRVKWLEVKKEQQVQHRDRQEVGRHNHRFNWDHLMESQQLKHKVVVSIMEQTLKFRQVTKEEWLMHKQKAKGAHLVKPKLDLHLIRKIAQQMDRNLLSMVADQLQRRVEYIQDSRRVRFKVHSSMVSPTLVQLRLGQGKQLIAEQEVAIMRILEVN
jgi:hypothetical protein